MKSFRQTLALGIFLPAAAWSSAGLAAQEFFCTFSASPTECGFVEQYKGMDAVPPLPGRASIVGIGRDGGTGVRLHTEPGDNFVAGSELMERNDLYLSPEATGCPAGGACEGREQWWAHSVLFPDDFAMPTWHMYVVLDFHFTNPGGGQANFHMNFYPQADTTLPGNLILRGFGGAQDMANPYAVIAVAPPVAKNIWYDFVYHVRWSSGSDGFFDAWLRKGSEPVYKRVLAHKGPTLYVNQGIYLKLANYHVPICEGVNCVGPASSVIHDRVARGTTWQDVVVPGVGLEGQYEEDSAAYASSMVPSTWTQYGMSSFSGGTIRASNEPGASATFAFTGTAVTWMGTRCNICGVATVSIDGGEPATVDTAGPNATDAIAPEPVFSASGLAPGAHTMRITLTGTHLAGSADSYVAVDGFWVTTIAPN
jgi:polysaccharide lyase-like protein